MKFNTFFCIYKTFFPKNNTYFANIRLCAFYIKLCLDHLLCMHLKKGLLPLTSSKVVFRTFLVTLIQIRQSYSSWITDCQHDFEKGKHLQNTFKQTLKFPSSVYDWAIPEKQTNGG